MNATTVAGSSSDTLVIAAGDLGSLTVAEAANSYSLSDTWATLSNAANAAIVAGAGTYAISDIGNLTNATVAQAGVLLGASNYDSQSYSLSDTLEAVLGAEPGLLDGAASVELSGNVQVSADLSAITAPLLFAGDTIAVADGQTLTLTAEQADGVTIRGEGNVVVTELGEDPVNLSGIAVNGSQTAMVLGGSNYLYMDPDSDLGSLEVVVAEDTDLSVTAAQANGMTIRSSGSGADNGLVHISDMVIGQAYDFSGISSGNGEVYTIIASGGTLNPDTKLGEMVIHVVYEADNTFTLTAAQADGRVIRCTESIGHIQITDMDVATQYDFAGIEASGASVSVVDTSGGPWRPTLD